MNTMSGQPFYEHLFEHSVQVTPYLKGAINYSPNEALTGSTIHVDLPSSECIRELYESLKCSHPEAGAPYWLTRTWTLLCWQPVYVAFIAIYACRGLPPLSTMSQQVHPNFVAGYQFDSDHYTQGSEQELILQAGRELGILFEYYQQEMSKWVRIRPGFTRHLIADGILGCLVKLSQFSSNLPKEYLFDQGRQWLSACSLPEKLIASLTYNEESKQLSLVRTSCCLVIKCDGRKLCLDCPRHPDNKR